jgi:diguanylate cyclase (GGDEF)-like protein
MAKDYSRDYTIVIVEDDPESQRMLTERLDEMAVLVIFNTTEEAFVYFSKGYKANLIIIDIFMQGSNMDGLELCHKVRSIPDYTQTSILLHNALGDQKLEALALKAGATDFLEKPMSVTRMRMRVAAHLASTPQTAPGASTAVKDTSKTSDELTSLMSRGAFHDLMMLELKRAGRLKYAVCLMMFNIDNHAEYNNRFGHVTGNRALMSFARALKFSFERVEEEVCRFDRETFAAFTSTVDPKRLLDYARKLDEIFNGLTIPHDDSYLPLSISTGIAIASFGNSQQMPFINEALLTKITGVAKRNMFEARNAEGHKLKYSIIKC